MSNPEFMPNERQNNIEVSALRKQSLNVYLCGNKVGVLSENQNAQLSFRYDVGVKTPLTVRMPVRESEYPHSYAYPYFENLTPEGEPLEIIANKLRISENNPFSVLEKIGGDCAGAVALYEGEMPLKISEPKRKISEKELSVIIDELPENPLLTGIKDPPRLSLAGAQSKFAVYAQAAKGKNNYYSPNDDCPSTNIIKIGNKRYKDILHNECFCMMLARDIGMSVAQPVVLSEAKGRLYLDIARYDREIAANKVERIHQEDFCQALGFPSAKKYQADGGPSMKNCYHAVIQYSHNKVQDAFSLLQWQLFNYLIGNADAHAKNISFLHKEGRVVLAPFYDLLSTEVYPQKIASKRIAMLINAKDIYEKLKQRDFLASYEHYGLNPLQTIKNVSSFFEKILEKANTLKNQLNSNSLTASPVYDDIVRLIKKRMGVFG